MGLMSVNVADLFLNLLVALASVSFSSNNVFKVTACSLLGEGGKCVFSYACFNRSADVKACL